MSTKSKKMPKILSGNCYDIFPEFYDLLYRRYLKSTDLFVKLVKKNTSRGGRILDLAAGTGEVSVPLLGQGFKVISFDKSSGMLKELARKSRKQGIGGYSTLVGDINHIKLPHAKFDTICIRQAINYYNGFSQLRTGLVKIRRLLKTDGRFIFNAPNFKKEKDEFSVVENLYKADDGINAFVLETNKISGRMLSHKQNSIVWGGGLNEPIHIFDENKFYIFTKTDFEKALKSAGFSVVNFYSTNLQPYSSKDKTIYCLAEK